MFSAVSPLLCHLHYKNNLDGYDTTQPFYGTATVCWKAKPRSVGLWHTPHCFRHFEQEKKKTTEKMALPQSCKSHRVGLIGISVKCYAACAHTLFSSWSCTKAVADNTIWPWSQRLALGPFLLSNVAIARVSFPASLITQVPRMYSIFWRQNISSSLGSAVPLPH